MGLEEQNKSIAHGVACLHEIEIIGDTDINIIFIKLYLCTKYYLTVFCDRGTIPLLYQKLKLGFKMIST